MADDVMSALLPAVLGGSSGAPSGDARAIGALEAIQSSPFAQGVPSQAGPIGQIAQAIMPFVTGPLYAKQAQQQQDQQRTASMVKVLSLVKELEGVDLKNAQVRASLKKMGMQDQLIDAVHTIAQNVAGGGKMPAGMKAKLGPQGATIEFGGAGEGKTLAERAAAGDPTAMVASDAEMAKRIKLAQIMAGGKIDYLAERNAELERERASKLTTQVPGFKGMGILNTDTLEEMDKGVRVGDLEDPNSPYRAIPQADIKTVRGAKVVMGQLDRLEQLIPSVLPQSRAGIPKNLVGAAVKEKPSAEAAEFDRLSAFEQLRGIRDLLANQRINQSEIQNVGKLSRYTDSQAAALGKVKAMRELVGGALTAMNLNPGALQKLPDNTAVDFKPGTSWNSLAPNEKPVVYKKLQGMYPGLTDEELFNQFKQFGTEPQ